jgi:hypothetical protein
LAQVLDQLEQRHPREQATLFRIRELAQELKQRAVHAEMHWGNGRVNSAVSPTAPIDPDAGLRIIDSLKGLRDEALKEKLREAMSVNWPIGYQTAQDVIFTKVHNFDGTVECVYTGRKIQTDCEPNANDMNIEHTWPQSQGAVGIAKSDLHHLFPTDSKANNMRGSYPFGKVSHEKWAQGGSKFDGKQFEVRDQQKGNTARAKFYFSIRYDKAIPPAEEKTLREWAAADPVDDAERARNDHVENLQHNRNLFVDHPELIKDISDF